MASGIQLERAALQSAEAFALSPHWHRGLPSYEGGYCLNSTLETIQLPTDTVLCGVSTQNLSRNQYWIGIADTGLLCDEKDMLANAIFNPNIHRPAEDFVLPEAVCSKMSLVQPDRQQRPGLAMEVGRLSPGRPRFNLEHASFVGRRMRMPPDAPTFQRSPGLYSEFTIAHKVAFRLRDFHLPRDWEYRESLPSAYLRQTIGYVAGVLAAKYAHKKDIPLMIEREDGYALLTDKTAYPWAYAPLTRPFANAASLINMCNLSTALRSGGPLFSSAEMGAIAYQLTSYRE